MARNLIPDKASANLAVDADGNCLYHCFLRGTKVAIMNYGFALFLSSCSSTSVCCKESADKVSMKSGFSQEIFLTIYLSSGTYGKNFKCEITEIWHVCMTSAHRDRGLSVTNCWSVGQFIL